MTENNNYGSENDNLQFKREIIQFYPEDQEKMDKMSIEERIQYRRRLKNENKYIIIGIEE